MTTKADGGYRDRILGLLGEQHPLESLERSARDVEDLARKLGGTGLSRSYGPGKWSGRQILAHLADAEVGIGFRVRQALAEEHHTIQPWDEGAWARKYTNVDPDLALRSFLALRAWNLALFRQLGPEELSREAYHPERGPETVGTILRLLAGHDLNHLNQLESILSHA